MHFQEVLDKEDWTALIEGWKGVDRLLEGRVIWNINATAQGGGVAEILQSLLAYARGSGIDARWMVITAKAPFFEVTKRLYNMIQGDPGDGGALGPEEKVLYDKTLLTNAEMFASVIKPQDIVVLHDPPTAGLAEHFKELGAAVVWRCHVGTDSPNKLSSRAWDFLLPYVRKADSHIFSCSAFVPEWIDSAKVDVIAPSIDAFSPKNQTMDPAVVCGVLNHAGIVEGRVPQGGFPIFRRQDGTPARVDHKADVIRSGPAPDFDTPLVAQVSRWDRLKDPKGVLRGFAEHVAPHSEAHLVIAGPAVTSVSDDPEGAATLAETRRAWQSLPKETRARVHLASLPMEDIEENAAIVNALQRHADVLVQKSLQEGFGLSVTEAMWKARPVVATDVGGVHEQIVHEESGLLLADPRDLEAFGGAVLRILKDGALAKRLGEEGQRRVRKLFLNNRHLVQYVSLLKNLLD